MKYLFFIASLVIQISAFSQDKPKWDINNPPGAFKDVTFTTNEGTWMNVDVSPD
jgi:hypothetical protein